MNRYYPIFLDLKGRSCLVVGGGEVACRKVAALLEAGADIRVVAFDAVRPLETLAEGDRIRLEKRGFRRTGTSMGSSFVIAATDDRALNERISGACDEKGIICNVVDQPDLCSAIIPSVVKRGRLQIARFHKRSQPGDGSEGFGKRWSPVSETNTLPPCISSPLSASTC